MNHDAAEGLFGVFRRAAPLMVVCALVAAVALNVQRQLSGPAYSADARVFLSTKDLGAILTNTQSPYVDPQRVSQNALVLARSSALYETVAQARPKLGTAKEIESVVTVNGDPESDVIDFVAETDSAARAIATANAVANGYAAFRSKVAGITTNQAINRLRQSLAQSPSNRGEIERLLVRLELERTLNSGDALVIDAAQSATKVAPTPLRDTALGIAIGLVAAVLIAGARELLSTRVRTEMDVEDVLGSPVIASIPQLPKSATIVASGRHEARFGDTYALLAASLEQDGRSAQEGGAMVLAVTSSVAGEGKTTTAANLGIAMAKRGKRVAIVDFDLRKPALARVFRLPAQSEGVLQVVESGRKVESLLWSCPISGNGTAPRRLPHWRPPAAKASVDRNPLVVIPAGGSDRTGAVARSPKAGEMIEWLRGTADVVIVDTPPALLAVEMSELSASVDSVLIVVRQGLLSRRDLSHLAKQTATWKADVRGVVLTGVPLSSEHAQYYYGV